MRERRDHQWLLVGVWCAGVRGMKERLDHQGILVSGERARVRVQRDLEVVPAHPAQVPVEILGRDGELRLEPRSREFERVPRARLRPGAGFSILRLGHLHRWGTFIRTSIPEEYDRLTSWHRFCLSGGYK